MLLRIQFIVLVLLTSGEAIAQSLNDSLLLHYPMSGNMNDVSGNNYHAVGNATLRADRFGTPNEAYDFNGLNQYMDFPNLGNLKPNLPVSISFWVKYDSHNVEDRAILNTSFQEDVNSGVFLTSQASTGKYAIGFGDGSNSYSISTRRTYVSEHVIDTSSWHHLVLVWTAATDMKVYVDCKEIGGVYSGSGGQLSYSLTPGSFGRHDQLIGTPAYHFDGAVDDFRYWNRALSIADVDSLCSASISTSVELPIELEEDVVRSYPNPFENEIEIQSRSVNWTHFRVSDMVGKIAYHGQFQSTLNLSRLPSGLYRLHLEDREHEKHQTILIMKR